MNATTKISFLASLISTLLLTGCGDAETNIVEQSPVQEEHDDEHAHDDDHDDEYMIESAGRLAVFDTSTGTLAMYDLDSKALLDSFSMTYPDSALTNSADNRFAVVTSRANDTVEFVDGGLWREDHVAHLHDYQDAPVLSDFTLSGTRPTHVDSHNGQLAVFFDGNDEAGLPASVQVVTDADIAADTADIPTLNFAVNMHGVAKPLGNMLISTVRREDSETFSANPVLPDSVGIYHWHDGEYEQEQLFAGECPDLHGAAITDSYAAFGCSDGVLVLHTYDEQFESAKISNTDAVGDLRVGSVYAHEHASSFIGVASGHGGGPAVLLSIDPEQESMEEIDWQPQDGASALSYRFSFDGEHFLILDNLGFVSVLSAHEHDGEAHWELETRIDISDQDVSAMPDGSGFTMTVSQNAAQVYVADPIASHIVIVDLESASITGELELDFVPAAVSWLGIAESHD